MTSLKENCVFDVVEVVEISSQTDLVVVPASGALGGGGVAARPLVLGGGTGGGDGGGDGQGSGRMNGRGNKEEI